MEVNIPIHIPDLTIRKLLVAELESMFIVLNNAHGVNLGVKEGSGKDPSCYFSIDLDEEIKCIEDAIRGLDLIHSFMVSDMTASMQLATRK